MNDALSQYLVELATNPTTLGEFRRDPSSARGRVAEADAELLLASSSSDALHARLTKPEDLVGDTGERELYEVAAADLTIVGSGIRAVGQFTIEALAAITAADKVWYLMSNEVGVAVIRALNPNCDSLRRLYVEGGLRRR